MDTDERREAKRGAAELGGPESALKSIETI